MKWRNHALMGGSISLMLSLYPSEVLYCMVAANLPDQLEKIGRCRVVGHRTWTHELLLWLLPLFFALVRPHAVPFLPKEITVCPWADFHKYFTIRTWVFFLPGLIHLAGDVMTPRGIQLASRKISMGLFRTGDPLEYVVAGLFVLVAVCWRAGWILGV